MLPFIMRGAYVSFYYERGLCFQGLILRGLFMGGLCMGGLTLEDRQAVRVQDGKDNDHRSAEVCCAVGRRHHGDQWRRPESRHPRSVRDNVKLGLGVDCATCPPSPLLHEVKLPGLVAGGTCFLSPVGWERTGNGPPSPLLQEVKLSGPGSGGPEVCRLRQEGKLALLHEVKLLGLEPGVVCFVGSAMRVNWPSGTR